MSEIRYLGEIRFDPATGEVSRAGKTVRLPNQPARVLAALTARPGELVTREELRTLIWGDGTYVSFNSCLNFCVREIRLALEDSARAPRHFETVPRRGYRFIGPVRVEIAGSGRPATARRPERLWLAAAFSLGLATGAVAAFLIGESPLHHQAVEWLHVRLDIPASHCPWPWR